MESYRLFRPAVPADLKGQEGQDGAEAIWLLMSFS